jgi:GcrA cell cycle regulator
MTWTDEAIAELRRLWDSPEKPSASVIAENFRTARERPSRSAIIGKVHRLGLSPRRSATTMPKPKPRHRPLKRTPPAQALRLGDRGWQAAAKFIDLVEPIAEFDDSAIPLEQRRQVHELEEHHCRFPCGDPAIPGDFFFCGAPKMEGKSYCPLHQARCYGSGRA